MEAHGARLQSNVHGRNARRSRRPSSRRSHGDSTMTDTTSPIDDRRDFAAAADRLYNATVGELLVVVAHDPDMIRNVADAYLKALSPKVEAQAGEWVMVPREPTEAMLAPYRGLYRTRISRDTVRIIWAELLSAAPPPPTVDKVERVARDAVETLRKQVPCTRAYLIDNGIDPNFADTLLSHYLDVAERLRAALAAMGG